MGFSTTLKNQVDQPVWEWLRFAPSAATAISSLASADDDNSRYIYEIIAGLFYRYDTISDSWCQLASPNIVPTVVALKYSSFEGYCGKVISATSTTIDLPALSGSVLKNKAIEIISGTGVGQKRTLTAVANSITADSGVVTAATANILTDTTKKWKINQWVGYQVAIVYGTGQTQYRKILYNNETSLTLFDTNWMYASKHNMGFSAIAPYAAPVATAGVQAHYSIESSTATVNTAWDITPDNSSEFSIRSGGFLLIGGFATTPFYSVQRYDILSDTWYTKTASQSILSAVWSLDSCFETIRGIEGALESATATSAAASSVTSSGLNMEVDVYANRRIKITGGTGIGQTRRIVGNTSTTLFTNKKWKINPNATSTFEVSDDTSVSFIAGNGASTLIQYNLNVDLPSYGNYVDHGIATNLSVRIADTVFDLVSAVRNANGITSVHSTPTAAGTNYTVGDILTISTGGTGGKVRVEAISPGGVVTAVSLYASGVTYTTGTGKAVTGGTGSGCTINILTVGVIGRLTTTINNNLRIGNTITFAGATDAAWNTSYVIIGVDSSTTFDVVITAAATAVAANNQSVSVLVDCSQDWDVNELAGSIVGIFVAGLAPTVQFRRIVSNTATTITLQSNITAATNGLSRYIVFEPWMNGRDNQSLVVQQQGLGWATGGSTTTLVDSTKNWIVDRWVGYKVRLMTGPGISSELAITANSATTLTFATQSFSPTSGQTKYTIMSVFGLATGGSTTTLVDSNKDWTVNQWAGKRVKITSGTAISQEVTITSNTATTLTFATAVAPSTDSTYTILGIPPRGAGVDLLHLFGTTSYPGRYLMFPRGGASNTADIFDISNDTWNYGVFYSPQSETLTTGSMYCYNGKNKIFFTKDATGKIFEYDVTTGFVNNCGTIPYAMSTAVIGNRMEWVRTVDGIGYIYIMRHSATEFWRVLAFWNLE